MDKLINKTLIAIHFLWMLFSFQACVGEQGIFTDVSEVNLDNMPQRSNLRIDGLAVHSKDRLYICDKRNNRVYCVLTQTAEVKEIKPTVMEEGKMWLPMAIAADDEKLYVAGHYLFSIFGASGNLIDQFNIEISVPTSVAVMKNGAIYIAGHQEGYVLHQYDGDRVRKPILKGFTHEDRSVVSTFSGGMVHKWKEGIVFGAKTPYELVALDEGGNIAKRVTRPELDFEPKFTLEKSGDHHRFHNQQVGKGLSVVATEGFVFYGYSLRRPESALYVDIYNHPLNPIAKDVQIDAVILGADDEGYLYFKRKAEGREVLFRGKFNERKFSGM